VSSETEKALAAQTSLRPRTQNSKSDLKTADVRSINAGARSSFAGFFQSVGGLVSTSSKRPGLDDCPSSEILIFQPCEAGVGAVHRRRRFLSGQKSRQQEEQQMKIKFRCLETKARAWSKCSLGWGPSFVKSKGRVHSGCPRPQCNRTVIRPLVRKESPTVEPERRSHFMGNGWDSRRQVNNADVKAQVPRLFAYGGNTRGFFLRQERATPL